MRWLSDSLSPAARPAEQPQPGDYLTDGRELYCVEELYDDHALIENCRSGALIDVDPGRLRRLNRVERSRSTQPEARV